MDQRIPVAPANFKPVETLFQVWKADKPFDDRGGKSAAHKAGLAYEKKAIDFLQLELADLPGKFVRSPWYRFVESATTAARYCGPDCIYIGEAEVICFEMKIRHVTQAWWQLRRLYQPVLFGFYRKPVRVCEVTKSYDVGVAWPERWPVAFDRSELRHWILEERGDALIWQWKGR